MFLSWPDFCLTIAHKVGRMMMNIRGLIMVDPEHTTHLQTLQFNRPANLDADIDEAEEDIEEVA